VVLENDRELMLRAISLAQLGPESDNPRVGAVIVKNGTVVAEGFHRGAGTPHAEIDALTKAGVDVRGATMYVSLEPCNHQGRTGPCSQAIINAGIIRVVFAASDRSSSAAGGATALALAGVEVVAGVERESAERLNGPWNHWAKTGMPFVTWKFAQSLDGRVSRGIGLSTRITGPTANAFTQDLRGRVGAIIVGTGTVLIDDPALNARDAQGEPSERQPIRVIIGNRIIQANSRIYSTPGERVIHFHTQNIDAVMVELGKIGVSHALLEGGPQLARAFLDRGLIQEVITITAPVSFGSGPMSLSTAGGAPSVNDAIALSDIHTQVLGGDLLVRGTVGTR
jgi:diaminohydroxyphosphoribosylaminopyrimidine deaminase/5-amino-6-(5-phosphoribosylamino)uracil reductase